MPPRALWDGVACCVFKVVNETLTHTLTVNNHNMTTYWDQALGPVELDTSEDLNGSNTHIQGW